MFFFFFLMKWKSLFLFFFFFSSRRRHTRYWRDWSSDVCSSDLRPRRLLDAETPRTRQRTGARTQLSGLSDRRRGLPPLRERTLFRGVSIHREPSHPPRGHGRRFAPHRHTQHASRLSKHRRPHPPPEIPRQGKTESRQKIG